MYGQIVECWKQDMSYRTAMLYLFELHGMRLVESDYYLTIYEYVSGKPYTADLNYMMFNGE